MAGSYDSNRLFTVEPGHEITITYLLKTDGLAPCCGSKTTRRKATGSLIGGIYLRFFDMHGEKGAFSPALGTHAPVTTDGKWVQREQRFKVPTTARRARMHLAFAAHNTDSPNRMRGGNATGSVAFAGLRVRDEVMATTPLPPTIMVPDGTVQAALNLAFNCLHNSQLSGQFTVSSGYTISGNINPDLTFGLHGIRRTGHAQYLETITQQWDAYRKQRLVTEGPRRGKIQDRVLAQIYWPLGVDQIFSASGDVDYLRRRLPEIDSSIHYMIKNARKNGLVLLIPKWKGVVGGGVDWNDWYRTRLDGRTLQFHMWLHRLLVRASHLHTEHSDTFGSKERAAAYTRRAIRLKKTLQQRFWQAQPWPHWQTNIDYDDEGEWIDDSVWSLYLGIATDEQRRALWANMDAAPAAYEAFPTKWARLDGSRRIKFPKGSSGGDHFNCSWFGRLGTADILARARGGRRRSSHALLTTASGVFAADGNIYEGYSMKGDFKKGGGCSTKGFGDYTEHCGGYIWAVVEGMFGLNLDSDSAKRTVASIYPQLPPEWNTASLRIPLRGMELRLKWERPVIELLLLSSAPLSPSATRIQKEGLRVRMADRCVPQQPSEAEKGMDMDIIALLRVGQPLRFVCTDSLSLEPPSWRSPTPDGRTLSRGEREKRAKRRATLLSASSNAANWAVPGEADKVGAGLLFFAYGGSGEVGRFLTEAMFAASSFKRSNPALNIAIVTNNKSVDASVFSHHITPRNELLFPGSPCPDVCRGDQLRRQWTTRLYYMALSPFEITWALDSGVLQCPGPFALNAVQRFLDDALNSSMWGFDIGHANQAKGSAIYPHNFNLIYRWTSKTSNVFRDWFLLQLRRGISTNDQDPLSLAETRQAAAGGLRVGQVPTEFAGAFYSVSSTFYPRLTRVLHGAAHIIHAGPDISSYWCKAFNENVGTARQIVIRNESLVKQPSALLTMSNAEACSSMLGVEKKSCPFQRRIEREALRRVQERPRLLLSRPPVVLNIKY